MRVSKVTVALIAGIAMAAVMMGPILAQQSASLTTPDSFLKIAGGSSVDAQRVQTNTYDWLISKSVGPSTVELGLGQSATLSYRLDVTRTGPATTTAFRTSITATVTNQATGEGGANTGTTNGLEVSARVLAVLPGNVEVEAGTGEAPVIGELDPGQSREYIVVVTYDLIPTAVNYRIEMLAEDATSSDTVRPTFTPPSAVTDTVEIDASVSVDAAFTTTPDGFSAAYGPGATWPRIFTNTGVYEYTATITNNAAVPAYVGSLVNTAILTKVTSLVTKTASASVIVKALAASGPALPPSESDDFPAAPAVATKLLDAAGIPHRYGSGRAGGNYISEVARSMSKGAAFPAYNSAGQWDGKTYVDKTDQVAYQAAVRGFLVSRGAF